MLLSVWGAGCGAATACSGEAAGARFVPTFTGEPHFPQNFEVILSSFPQFSQYGIVNHSPQKTLKRLKAFSDGRSVTSSVVLVLLLYG